jgi:hypothetical protein
LRAFAQHVAATVSVASSSVVSGIDAQAGNSTVTAVAFGITTSIIEMPQGRVIEVNSDRRTNSVDTELRVFAVDTEGRTIYLAAESRTVQINRAEGRSADA